MSRGKELYPHLFEPIRIGPVDVRNRLFLAPHGTMQVKPVPSAGYGMVVHDETGSPIPHPNLVEYYRARAPHLGLIVQGGINVHPQVLLNWCMLTEAAVPAFRPIVEAVHEHGTKIFAQLHLGNASPSGVPWYAAAYETPLFGFPRAATKDDIRMIHDRAARSTRNAVAAGYDGVEMHAAHGYAAGLWFSPHFNRRTDEYGGSLENRARFGLECLEAMREAAGPHLALGVRMTVFEGIPDGLETGEAGEIARLIDRSGLVDYISLDIGTNHSMHLVYSPHHLPEGYEAPYIAASRAFIEHSVVLGTPGRFQDPAGAERLIAEGAMDLVGGVRGWFADPELARKIDEGRFEQVRPCIGLSSCHMEGSCVMNPLAYREWRYDLEKARPAGSRRRIVVVGGGPSGLEAARVSALRGHDVVLYESAAQLGGALNLQARLPTREGVLRAARWWGSQLAELGVDVRLGAPATADDVVAQSPDAVVVATGAAFDPQGITGLTGSPIPGWDLDHVYTPEELLGGDVGLEGNVVIFEEDAGETASDIAWKLALGGAKVELATRFTHLARGYTGLESGHRQHFVKALYELDVMLSPDTYIRAIEDHRVTLYNIHTERERVVDDVGGVVLVGLRRSVNDLVAQLSGRVEVVRVVGDASLPGRMAKATREGFETAWELAELFAA